MAAKKKARKAKARKRGQTVTSHRETITDRCIKAATRAGWIVELRKGGHLVFRAPDPGIPLIHASDSPGDWRGPKNLRSLLRRHGLTIR